MKCKLLLLFLIAALCFGMAACGGAEQPATDAAPTTLVTLPPEAEAPISSAPDVVGDQNSTMVWIPTKGGVKYHSDPECSNMIDPEYVSVTEAALKGFTPCTKCH